MGAHPPPGEHRTGSARTHGACLAVGIANAGDLGDLGAIGLSWPGAPWSDSFGDDGRLGSDPGHQLSTLGTRGRNPCLLSWWKLLTN